MSGPPIGSVARAIALLDAVAESEGGARVNELARRIGVNPSTASRLLGTLEGEGTKSTVIASPPPGTLSVAVSPVSCTSQASHGRARSRTSSCPSTRSDRATSLRPRR